MDLIFVSVILGTAGIRVLQKYIMAAASPYEEIQDLSAGTLSMAMIAFLVKEEETRKLVRKAVPLPEYFKYSETDGSSSVRCKDGTQIFMEECPESPHFKSARVRIRFPNENSYQEALPIITNSAESMGLHFHSTKVRSYRS